MGSDVKVTCIRQGTIEGDQESRRENTRKTEIVLGAKTRSSVWECPQDGPASSQREPFPLSFDLGKEPYRERWWLARSCTALAEPRVEGKSQHKYWREVIINSTSRWHTPVWQLSSLWQEGKHEWCLKGEKNDMCCPDTDYRARVCYSGNRTQKTTPSRYLHSLSTEKGLISCFLIWLGLWTYAQWPDRPCNRIYSVHCFSDLLVDSPINQKVSGMTQGFVILYLILTNKDKLLMELKLSGT